MKLLHFTYSCHIHLYNIATSRTEFIWPHVFIGEMIENSMKTVGAYNEKEVDKDGSEKKEIETGDKHGKVHSKPRSNKIMDENMFEKQEKLRQKMEELVDKQGLQILRCQKK